MMPSQEVHKAFVVRVRKAEQWQHFPIASASTLEALPNEMLHMSASEQPFSKRPGDGIPKVSHDHIFGNVIVGRLKGQEDIFCLNGCSGSDTHRRFKKVL